ncbi:MAG: M28 family peptidase [Terriglobales bacterium]|jgi:Zn-dependent M28 family amino/carboxypeptidase
MRRYDKTLLRKFLGHLAGALIVGIACAVCACAQTSAQTSPQMLAQIHFRLRTREAVAAHLKSFSTRNSEREALIRKWFGDAGCTGANLSEQGLDRRLPPNVICVLPGETAEVIVVGAHTDKVESFGDGVVDNWTGAALLPSLVYSLSAQPRHHTLIFVGFSGEEKGLVGSRYYVDHLSNEQRAHVEGMVNFDSLGLGPTEVWASHADQVLLDALAAVAFASKMPVTTMNVDDLGTADSESFARYQIPRITLHSVTQQTWPILHSPFDKMAAIKMNDYYDSYRLIAEYLAYLDDALKAPPAVKPVP